MINNDKQDVRCISALHFSALVMFYRCHNWMARLCNIGSANTSWNLWKSLWYDHMNYVNDVLFQHLTDISNLSTTVLLLLTHWPLGDFILIIPIASTKLIGGHTGITLSVCPSVRLWTESCPLCIFNNTHRIHFIFAHLIKQLQKVCRV